MNRRGFLNGILATAIAPAIVRSESLMKIWVPPQEIITGGYEIYSNDMAVMHAKDIEEAILYGRPNMTTELARLSFARMITRLMPNGDAPLYNLTRNGFTPRIEE